MNTIVRQYTFDDSYEGQIQLINRIKQQEEELREIRLLNENLADCKPTLAEILERYGIKKSD